MTYEPTGTIDVLGVIWMPGVACFYTYTPTVEAVAQYSKSGKIITRDAIQQWLDTHAGDFSSITDFHAEIDGLTFDWQKEDSADTVADILYG